ncbi:MAG: hypothetical protein NC548_51605 [Lachnospiraceae bacterium]|nr:hypothetical protein [Lachnospiraceae bacterium]
MSELLQNIYEGMLKEEIATVSGSIYDDIRYLDKYPVESARKVLGILIQSACIGQNLAPIELGRRKIMELDHQWLVEHFIEVADTCINYSDEWEYRRLVELTVLCVPELKLIVLDRGRNSANEEIREVVADFSDYG